MFLSLRVAIQVRTSTFLGVVQIYTILLVIPYSRMLFECVASCLLPRREKKGVDVEERAAAILAPTPVSAPMSVPMSEPMSESAYVPVSGQQAPETGTPVPLREHLRANDDGNGAAPGQVDLGFFTSTGCPQIIRVTVDHSKPVNLVTDRCVRSLGYEPLTGPAPAALRELASSAIPASFAWQRLHLYRPWGHNGNARLTHFVVVGDHDLACDILLGREFERVSFDPVQGIYPNYAGKRTPGASILIAITAPSRGVLILSRDCAAHEKPC